MKCPYCSSTDTKVVDSRINQTGDITRRRRECIRCEGRYTTYERVEEVMPLVIKKDGRREPYAREKILDGMKKATQKRAVPTQRLDELVTGIEKRLQSYGLKEIPAKTVGHMVMAELHKLDKVAYVRFASVYREFKDVEEFVAELQDADFKQANDDPSLMMFPFAANDSESGGDAGSGRS
ncbi:MAG: transcriptional regulator NrdR [Bdellovibrionales bacterium RIFOXYD1_FULL_53_11]|nr:MAG: transcriptional regulator NrdR [Bdellovibrionales bacterium RIFOXYD1_FULL_53_11]